jgi:hypothetical protein
MRDRFATEALAQIPKILTLQDRNPHSPHYGCFDRNYWQYKIIDFPSGMSQEFVWPLALVYALDIPDNPYYQQAAVREWTIAGMEFAARSAHPDGSCDDYFPYERAGGAAAFSLLACLEAFQLLKLKVEDYPKLVAFFERRANWLAHHHESGQLTNHQALIVLCLEKLGRLLRTDRWEAEKLARLQRVLSWQNPEGWFQEYEGCDPGYHSLTIGCLAEYLAAKPESLESDTKVRQALHRAIDLAQEFIHPDGSYGGEYASRNTYNFFPHGFERAGRDYPAALRITDQFLVGLAAGRGPCYADDHIVGHHTWSYLLAWQQFAADRPAPRPRPQGRVWLADAQILIDRRGRDELYIALNKGGVFKLFRDRQLLLSDTQFSLQVRDGGKLRNAVGHLVGDYGLNLEADRLTIQGQLGWAKQKQMTPLNLLILRGVMLTVGRFFPNLIRKLLQKMLITGKTTAPFSFVRQIEWIDGQIQISDELKSKSWSQVESIGISGHQTSIYVVMSRTYQVGQLQPWLDLTDRLAHLKPGQTLGLDRRI